MMTRGSIPSRAMSPVGERNLGLLAQRSFERRGDYPSLMFEGRWHGSGELWSRSQRLAGGFAELGVAPGDRVVVCMANCPEVSIAYQALWLAGAVVTPATFLLPAPDLRHVIADAEGAAVITTPEFIDKVIEATEGLDHVRFVISTEATGGRRRARPGRTRASRSAPDRRALRRRPRRAALHRRHDRPRQGRDALPRQPVLLRPPGPRRRPRARRQPPADDAAALPRLRPAGDDRRDAQLRAGHQRAAALVRSRHVPGDDRRASAPAQRGGAHDAPDPARPAAGGLRPLDAASG